MSAVFTLAEGLYIFVLHSANLKFTTVGWNRVQIIGSPIQTELI